jgi:hypothetical protein
MTEGDWVAAIRAGTLVLAVIVACFMSTTRAVSLVGQKPSRGMSGNTPTSEAA